MGDLRLGLIVGLSKQEGRRGPVETGEMAYSARLIDRPLAAGAGCVVTWPAAE